MSILKQRRERLGWTQQVAAHRCGLAQGTISAYESGDVRRPSTDTVAALAAGYGLSFSRVLKAVTAGRDQRTVAA